MLVGFCPAAAIAITAHAVDAVFSVPHDLNPPLSACVVFTYDNASVMHSELESSPATTRAIIAAAVESTSPQPPFSFCFSLINTRTV